MDKEEYSNKKINTNIIKCKKYRDSKKLEKIRKLVEESKDKDDLINKLMNLSRISV